jgi:glycosyltransferase involved in cell wall biosynthesis
MTKPIILYIGQWRKHKNLVRLLEAFKFVKNKFNIDCQIVICGTKDPAYPEIIETIDRLKLFDDTIMPGFIDSAQLPLWYKMADVFVFPSFYEGFGLPPLEAMAVGTPVVASKSSCLPEVLGDAAVYFDYTSSKDLADKIASVLKKKSLRAELKRKGRKQAKKYSWEKTAQETLEIYQRSFK